MFHQFLVIVFVISIISLQNADANTENFQNKSANIDHMLEVMAKIKNYEEKFFKIDFGRAAISEQCSKQLILYAKGLIPHKDFLKEWALKMFDATGKLQSGILGGNIYSLGSFDECLSIRNEVEKIVGNDNEVLDTAVISGKYCLGSLGDSPQGPAAGPGSLSMTFYLGMCIPAACSAQDITTLMTMINIPLSTTDEKCQVYEESVELRGGDIATIVFLGFILTLAVLSTAYDILTIHFKKERRNLLLSFSVLSNGRKLFSTAKTPDQLECLAGLRTISMMWIMISHQFSSVSGTPIENMAYLLDFFQDGWTMYIRGAPVSVDTFLLLSGIVLIYVYMKSTKEDQCFFNVFQYYLHRYIRLTPALAVFILLHVTLVKYMGSGPIRPLLDPALVGLCEKNWWVTLLYVQNYVNYQEICIGQSWYLAVDFQLFIFSPLILIPLRRWPKQTLCGVVVLIGASLTSSFITAYILKLHDINFLDNDFNRMIDYMLYFYTAPYTRASPWLIGILVGYFLYHVKFVKKSFKIHWALNLAFWAISIAVMATCVFYDHEQQYDRVRMAYYIAYNRTAWAIAVAWVVVACVTGYGGPINSFLSLPLFQILARLTYSLYIVHITIIMIVYASGKSSTTISNAYLMYNFWSMYMVCIGVAIVWTLLFESPIIMIEKALKTKKK